MLNSRVVLFLAKNQWSKIVVGLIECYLPDCRIETYWMAKGDKIPDIETDQTIDLCISFLSPRIIPVEILQSATLKVNFHPGDRHFPGIGCYNFALYEQRNSYGVVCHHMDASVDTGEIIIERIFPVAVEETIETLQFKSYCCLMEIVREFLELYKSGSDFSDGLISWTRKPFTRKDLNALAEISDELQENEKVRRGKATAYPGFGILKNKTPLINRIFNY